MGSYDRQGTPSLQGQIVLPSKAQTGLGTFKQILETQIAPAGRTASGSNPSEIPDEKTLRKLIEIIRLRMMMDEHMLESTRDRGSDLSLYQRFARLQMGGINVLPTSIGQGKQAEPVKPDSGTPAGQPVD